MLRPVFVSLTIVIFFSLAFANFDRCAYADRDLCELEGIERYIHVVDRREAPLRSRGDSVTRANSVILDSARIPTRTPGRVTCRTPAGKIKNQEYCYYAIDTGDPSKNFKVYYNKKNDDKNPHVKVLKDQIRPFCLQDDVNFIGTKLFPAFMTREENASGKKIRRTLTDTWVYCCRYNCTAKLEPASGNMLKSDITLAIVLAKTYFRNMPRTAMGVSKIEKADKNTCYTEDLMNSPKLPYVSTCHSFFAKYENDSNVHSGRMLYNRISDITTFESDGPYTESPTLILRTLAQCNLTFSEELGLEQDKTDICVAFVHTAFYFRYCCCPNNMSLCAPRKSTNKDTVLCASGDYATDRPLAIQSLEPSHLSAKECVLIYRWHPDNTKVEVIMKPRVFPLETYNQIGNFRCKMSTNKNTACPHIDIEPQTREIACICNFTDFCNIDYHFDYKSKDIVEGLAKGWQSCAYTPEHFFQKDAFVRDDNVFCPVFFDLAKRVSMNFVNGGNMEFIDNDDNVAHRVANERCRIVEIRLNKEVLSALPCDYREKGYQDADFHLPRLVLLCACTDGKERKKNGEQCDVALRKDLTNIFTKTFERILPKCYMRRTEFNVTLFNIADHVKVRSTIENSENAYCYQAYSSEGATGFLESGPVTSNNEKYAKMCAKLIADKVGCIVTKDKEAFCCCRAEKGVKEPCNDLLISRALVDLFSIDGYADEKDCSGEVCHREDPRCYVERGLSRESHRVTGCITRIDEKVHNNSSLRHLQVCELEHNQNKCVAELRSGKSFLKKIFLSTEDLYGERRCVTRKPASKMRRKNLEGCRRSLLAQRLSEEAANILQEATPREIRGIMKVTEDTPWMSSGGAMDWATEIVHVAVRNPGIASTVDAYQLGNALNFIKQRLKSKRVILAEEGLFLDRNLLEELKTDFEEISRAYLYHIHRSPSTVAFNSLLSFAAHYAKHAERHGLTVAEYLSLGEGLLKGVPVKRNGCWMYKATNGWTLVVAQEHGCCYARTLHLKAVSV
ncbi:hypothetical protein QR680_007698 [Steinernema hermaphroditum]|uniref:Uncharacterized protein n=1 Tax=Steinernema hermaphroditum TaxID=289476 RepID=A0AA39IE12_9BILA|nr:hypothetical protein QR680_007698 [Steinernema hermaphroditum]